MTNRRNFLYNITLAAGAVSFIRPLGVLATPLKTPDTFPATHCLTILHTSNLLGQRLPLGANEKLYGLGGLQNVLKSIQHIRSKGNPVVAIHTGDILGSANFSELEQKQFFREMFTGGYDVVMSANNFLVKGTAKFHQAIKKSGILFAEPGKRSAYAGLMPWKIIPKGGNMIGIISVEGSSAKEVSSKTLKNTADRLSRTALYLKENRNCSVIIGLAHASKPNCITIAEYSTGIDAMLTSVDNNTIHNINIVRNKAYNEVMVSYAGNSGTMISRIDITLNKNFNKIHSCAKPLFVSAKAEESIAVIKRFNAHDV